MIICKNCGANFEGKFCNNCGQKNYTEKDKSFSHLFEEVFHFVTHFEGAFFTTVKTIFIRPGKLTVDYCNGIRKKYYKPISLFLLVIIMYLLFPIFSGLNPRMKEYRKFYFSPVVSRQIDQRLAETHVSEETFATEFEHKSHTVAKFLMLVLIPLSAFVISLLFFRKRPLFDNFILATEINIFFLLALFFVLPLILLGIIRAGVNMLDNNDEAIAMIVTILFSLYGMIIFRNVFKTSRFISLLSGIAFAFIHLMVILVIYKLLVFEVTFFLL